MVGSGVTSAPSPLIRQKSAAPMSTFGDLQRFLTIATILLFHSLSTGLSHHQLLTHSEPPQATGQIGVNPLQSHMSYRS